MMLTLQWNISCQDHQRALLSKCNGSVLVVLLAHQQHLKRLIILSLIADFFFFFLASGSLFALASPFIQLALIFTLFEPFSLPQKFSLLTLTLQRWYHGVYICCGLRFFFYPWTMTYESNQWLGISTWISEDNKSKNILQN